MKYSNKKIIDFLESYEAGGLHGQLPVIWSRAKDSTVVDANGNKYIDFTSTIFVTNCGHLAVGPSVAKQAKKLIHSYTFPTEEKYEFLKELKSQLPKYCEKVFLASAGSEVTSWAINLMRAHTGKKNIVHISGAFHGKTGSVVKLEHEEICIPFDTTGNNFWEIEGALDLTPNIAGVMIESYQGWSARFMDKEFIRQLCEWAKKRKIPICFDEIQGGFWRTGKLFAYEHYEVEPDLVCMGKGLGGGLPISALAGRKEFFNVPGLSSTHSGNPLCCAGALEALRIYRKLNKIDLRKKSLMLFDGLQKIQANFSMIGEVNGRGLLASLICANKYCADEICETAMKKGLLLVRTGRESIKIGPPLTISFKELKTGLDILSESVAKVYAKVN